MVIGLACKALGKWPEGRLGGFFKPTLQVLTKSLVAFRFFSHVKNGGFRFAGERGPFSSGETPIHDDDVLSSEDSVFLMHLVNFVKDIREVFVVHGGLKCLDFLSLCFSQFVVVHANARL